MQESANSLNNRPVAALRNTRFLVGVMDTQLLKSSPGLQVRDKVAAKVFSTSIRIQHLYSNPKMIFHPSFVIFVGGGLLVFRSKKVDVGEASFIVNVSVHVVFSAF